jgi:hypothetical protein
MTSIYTQALQLRLKCPWADLICDGGIAQLKCITHEFFAQRDRKGYEDMRIFFSLLFLYKYGYTFRRIQLYIF